MKKLVIRSLLSVGFIGFLGACGAADQGSDVKVTNGKVIANSDFPSVVTLYDAKLGAMCTGTFINETTVISAAHCTEGGTVDASGKVDGSLSIIEVTDLAAGQATLVATSTGIVRNRLWDTNGKNVNKYDLSLITFPAGTAKAVSSLATAAPKVGDALTIVGYGLNQTKDLSDGATAGVKRVGTNSVTSVSSGFIEFIGASVTTTADGVKSASSSGDSGGPLFINGKVAGVTSGGGPAGLFSSQARSLYVNLSSPESKAFLSKYLKP